MEQLNSVQKKQTPAQPPNLAKQKNNMTKRNPIAITALTTIAATTAWGWSLPPSGTPTVGTVDYIEVGSGGGFQFRLTGNPALCASGTPNTLGFAYPNQVANGETMQPEGVRQLLSTITAAKLAGRPIRVFADAGGAGGCKVGVIDLL